MRKAKKKAATGEERCKNKKKNERDRKKTGNTANSSDATGNDAQ